MASPSAGPTPTNRVPTERIAFVSERDGDLEIYAVSPDGSDLVQLAHNDIADGDPAWSPDGMQIAYLAGPSSRGDLYNADVDLWVMNADGSNARRLADIAGQGGALAWSPDGTRIAFQALQGEQFAIHVAAVDGTGTRQLTDNGADNLHPAWSPDGLRIAYDSTAGGGPTPDDTPSDIFVMDADGSNVKRLTDNNAVDVGPRWSPDGSRIVFASKKDGLDLDIYVMNADGSDVIQLTANAYDESRPAWSPDGTWIAFASDPTRSMSFGLSVMDAHGADTRRLTEIGGDVAFCWSPDAKRIAFFGGAVGDDGESAGGIDLVDVDGGRMTRVVTGASWESGPAWSPILRLN